MNKILFIVPPHLTYGDFINPAYNKRVVHKKGGDFGNVLTDMPLGVLSLSAYIKKHLTVETKVIDYNIVLNSMEDFTYESFYSFFLDYLWKHQDFKPDVICISSLFTPAYKNFLEIATCCRTVFPWAYILGGGGVPTTMYEDIYKDNDYFDALCYGEGEKPLLGFLQAEDKHEYLWATPSWITMGKVMAGHRYQHNFITDLDEIPFYDYSICDTIAYGLNPALTAYASIDDKTQNLHYMTSRGCTFRCCFCASHKVSGRVMRSHSVERVARDLYTLKHKYGAKTIVFQDDHFMFDKERALKIVAIVKDLGLRPVFQNGLALYALDRPTLEALKDAGADQLLLSVESGSERVLKDIMHKPLNLATVQQVCRDCRELGIYMNVNVLIGLPGETKEDLEDTRQFLRTLYANWFLIFCASPLVGSEMYDLCKEKGYLKDGHIGSDYKKAVVETEDFSAQYIQEFADLLNLELNFVYNSDFKLGNYEMALKGFLNSIRAKNDHAIAYHYASKCYEQLAIKHLGGDPFWRKYVEMLNVPI